MNHSHSRDTNVQGQTKQKYVPFIHVFSSTSNVLTSRAGGQHSNLRAGPLLEARVGTRRDAG